MSLNYKLTNVKDWEKVCFIGANLNPTTESIIWMTIATGIGNITERDALTFYRRCRYYWALFSTAPAFTWEDVQAHVGLQTNVWRESKKAWSKRMWTAFVREIPGG